MTDRLKGGCRCGAVGYEIALSGDLPVYCCHCLDCQKWSGSAFAEQGVIREDAIKTQGPVITSPVASRQGGQTIQYVCGICHSRIYSTNPARPGIALLRAGTLDETDKLRPQAHVWVKSKQPWVTLPGDVPAFEEAPPSEEIRALLRPAS